MLARIRRSLDEKDQGFTLIELLVVIIIIGILAAIAIPVFLSQRKKGFDAQTKSDLRNLATSEESYLTDNPSGYVACASASACLTTLSASQGLKLTSGDLIEVQLDGTSAIEGYCAVALSKSGNYYQYDSENGGLQSATYATLAAVPHTAGACAGLTIGTPA